MRYPASEKLEIIRLVEGSHLPAKRTLEMLGVPRSTFHRWYARWRAFGEAGLEDRRPHPGRVWNRIPDEVRQAVVDLALDEPELSPRELAVRFTDEKRHFVSEASVYRILKAQDLIVSPAFVVIKGETIVRHRSEDDGRATSSATRPSARTSSGRPTSPTSRSWAGAGTT